MNLAFMICWVMYGNGVGTSSFLALLTIFISGGSWFSSKMNFAKGNRFKLMPDRKVCLNGFRVLRSADKIEHNLSSINSTDTVQEN